MNKDLTINLLDGATSQAPTIPSELETQKRVASNVALPLEVRIEAFEDIIDSELGDTTLSRARNIEREVGLRQIYLKFKGGNPFSASLRRNSKRQSQQVRFDKEKRLIKFDRMLFSAVHYPSDYGFIPETLAEDGDPLDALVLVWEPTFPGCLIEAKPIAVFKMWDEKGPDEKILCVPDSDPNWNHLDQSEDVPPHFLKEIEHFFAIYKELEKKKTGVEVWEDRAAAVEIIEKAQQRYQSDS